MIVDDSEINREILASILEEDYQIIEAENGEDCLRLLQKYGTEISLILLDIVMPGMNGFQVLHDMNKNHWIEDVPVIMISSEDSEKSIRLYQPSIRWKCCLSESIQYDQAVCKTKKTDHAGNGSGL